MSNLAVQKTRHRMAPSLGQGHGLGSTLSLLQDKDCPPPDATPDETRAANQMLFNGNTEDLAALGSLLHKVGRAKASRAEATQAAESEELPDLCASEVDDMGLEWCDMAPTELSFLPIQNIAGQMPAKGRSWSSRI